MKFEFSLQHLRFVIRKLVKVEVNWNSRLRHSCIKFGKIKIVEQ